MLSQGQARHLAALLASIREDWDEHGIFVALGRVKHERPVNIILAAARAADDPKAETPGVIPAMDGPHWLERKGDPVPWRPPKSEDACRAHPGEWRDRCRLCVSEAHVAFHDDDKPVEVTGREQAIATAKALMASKRANLCRHGAAICHDCENARTSEQEPA